MKLTFGRRRLRIYRLLTVMHSHPGGRSVLRGDASWRTASGLLVSTRWGHVQWMFRRAA